MSIAALEAVFMGIGDPARLKGVAADVRDPKMAGVLREAVKDGCDGDVQHRGSETLDEILTSADMLWEVEIEAIWVPNPSQLASHCTGRSWIASVGLPTRARSGRVIVCAASRPC